MTLGHPIQVRLTPARQLFYEEEAARLDKRLATYLRERLEQQDDQHARDEALRTELANGMAEIRGMVERSAQATQSTTNPDPGVMMEILLLLRAVAGPDRIKMAHAEVKRQGLRVWTGKE